MRGSGGVRRRSRLGVLIAIGALVIALCGAAPAAAEPARASQTATASISGTVTDSAGQPIAGATVDGGCSFAPFLVSATTAADGTYTISGLQPPTTGGTCSLQFSATGYVSQYWNNKPSGADSDPISVSVGQTVTGIDAVLQTAGSITGNVTDASTGQPAPPAYVGVTATNVTTGQHTNTGLGTDGAYTFSELAPGTYTVEFSGLNYVTQYWNDKPSRSDADPITVVAGQTVTGIDAAVAPTTDVLVGNVSDAVGGQSLDQATVVATNTATGQSTTVQTDVNGQYAFTGLVSGTYTVEYSAPNYVTEWFNNKTSQATADPVTITAGQTTNINVTLAPATGAISGRVTNSVSQPIAGATVQATCQSGQSGSAITAADGTYTISFATPSTGDTCFILQFSATGYVSQFGRGPISVAFGQTVTGIDAVLLPVKSLSGVVDGTSGTSSTPLAGATVVVHNYYGFTVAQTTTGADGTWSVGNLGGGVYRVEFQPPAGSDLLSQWWFNEPDGAHSDGVALAAGGAVGDINATLISGAAVSGTVTDSAGPVAGATVGVFTVNASNQPGAEIAHTTTAADGSYNVTGLQAGNYDVLIDPPPGSADVGQWFNNSPTAGGATNITLATSGSATANAELTTGQRGSISGTVTDTSGNPIAGSTVLAVAADGRTTTPATTAADGTYSIDNLDVGIDTVWFLPPAGSNFGASVWNLAVGKVMPVTVDQGSATTGIDATLSQNGA